LIERVAANGRQIKTRRFFERLQEDESKVLFRLCRPERLMWRGVLVDATSVPLARDSHGTVI